MKTKTKYDEALGKITKEMVQKAKDQKYVDVWEVKRLMRNAFFMGYVSAGGNPNDI